MECMSCDSPQKLFRRDLEHRLSTRLFGVLVKLTWYMISIVLGGSTYFLHLWKEQVGGWFPISALSPVQRKITYTTSPRSFFSVGKLCHEASEVGWMLHGKDHVPLFLCFFAGGDVLSVTEKNLPKDHHLIWGCWMNHRFYPKRNLCHLMVRRCVGPVWWFGIVGISAQAI